MTLVVDASVVLAYLLDEPGGDVLTGDGPFCLSTVNLAEILTKAIERGLASEAVMRVLEKLPIDRFDYLTRDAVVAAELRPATRRNGLSLGDRACLALGRRLDATVLTAERRWAELDIGIDVRLIR